MGASGASAPPASIMSARPARIAWSASPTAMVPEAQLMALVEFGPVNPNAIAILQLAAPGNTASASAGSSPRGRSEERRVGKGVELGGRRRVKEKQRGRRV